MKLAIVAALLAACDAGEPYDKLPAPPTLDEHLIAIPPLAMPHGDFAERPRYERALRDFAATHAKVVAIAACTGEACEDAARNAGAGRLVYGTIERGDDKTYVALEVVGLVNTSYAQWSNNSVLEAGRFFIDNDMLAKMLGY
ncbi:MAG TPA: hypothetical protein VGG28_10400 [Kofleriaceae bacterium]